MVIRGFTHICNLRLNSKFSIKPNTQTSDRCRMYKEIKPTFGGELYLEMNINTRLRSCLTKLRLSSHKYLVERGRWLKPKLPYIDRKCTLCNIPDIQDEYHVTLCCLFQRT